MPIVVKYLHATNVVTLAIDSLGGEPTVDRAMEPNLPNVMILARVKLVTFIRGRAYSVNSSQASREAKSVRRAR